MLLNHLLIILILSGKNILGILENLNWSSVLLVAAFVHKLNRFSALNSLPAFHFALLLKFGKPSFSLHASWWILEY